MIVSLLTLSGYCLAQNIPQITYIGTFARIEGKPVRLAIDERDNVYVSDTALKRVHKFDIRGNPSGHIDRFIIKPLSVAPSRDGRIFEGDLGDGSLRLYTGSGNFIKSINIWGPVEHAGGAAFYDDMGFLYVSDSKNHRVLIFDMLRDGMLFGEFGGFGSEPGQFDFPTDITVDPASGEILICDVGNGRVQVFDYLGNFRAVIGRKGGGYETSVSDDELIRPQGVAVDRKGRIYIADTFLSVVKVFDRYGEFLKKIGSYGNGEGQFNLPTDVAIDRYNRLFVLNEGSSRVELFGIDEYSEPPLPSEEGGRGGCFISALASGSSFEKRLDTLRRFRDEVLKRSLFGNSLVSIYYYLSPYGSRLMQNRKHLKDALRPILEPVFILASFGLNHPIMIKLIFFLCMMIMIYMFMYLSVYALFILSKGNCLSDRSSIQRLSIRLFVLFIPVAIILDSALALDAPHNLTNNYDCNTCHMLHDSLGSPLINATAVNNLCKSCHTAAGPGTDVETHSGNRFSFATKCTDCHSPHGQNQKKNTGATLSSGNSTSLTSDTLTDTSKAWTSGQWVGYTLIPNTASPYAFKIISNTANSVTVKTSASTGVSGNPSKLTDVASAGNPYRIIYGKLIGYNYGPEQPMVKSYANGTWYTILFFNRTGSNSFADSDTNYTQDICNVCHSQTNHHQFDGSAPGGQSHNDGANCVSTCHPHKQKFWAVGGDCIDCHSSPQGSLPRRAVVGAGGDFIKRSRHVTNGTTTQVVTKWECSVCHAEGNHITGDTTTYHADGIVQVKNADTGAVIQIETSARSRNYDQGLVDLFCVSCHDSDGATATYSRNPAPIRVTPTATNPFGDGGTNSAGTGLIQAYQEYVQGGNLGAYYPRPRVIDVKSQFTRTANTYSDHALAQPAGPGQRYTTVRLRSGAWVSPWNDTSTTHCSDCHYNDKNAHGTANTKYILDDASGNDSQYTGESSYVCFKCHAYAAYNSVWGDGNEGNSATAYASISHPIRDRSAHVDENRNRFGIYCLSCHGGREGGPDSSTLIAQGRAFGGIHGTDRTITNDGGGTHTPYRFTNGAALDYISAWESISITCSSRRSTDIFDTNCKQHG
ncbi:MAG: CFI-box-CTERM domain-containing protein, partial [Candidatus Aenigmatarchaeota archaeon]